MWEIRQERCSSNLLQHWIRFHGRIPTIWYVFWSWPTPWLVQWQVHGKDHTKLCSAALESQRSLAFVWDSWSTFSSIQNHNWSQEVRPEGSDYESPYRLRTTSDLAQNSSADWLWVYHFLHQWRNCQEIQLGEENPQICCSCPECQWNSKCCRIHHSCCHCLPWIQSQWRDTCWNNLVSSYETWMRRHFLGIRLVKETQSNYRLGQRWSYVPSLHHRMLPINIQQSWTRHIRTGYLSIFQYFHRHCNQTGRG